MLIVRLEHLFQPPEVDTCVKYQHLNLFVVLDCLSIYQDGSTISHLSRFWPALIGSLWSEEQSIFACCIMSVIGGCMPVPLEPRIFYMIFTV